MSFWIKLNSNEVIFEKFCLEYIIIYFNKIIMTFKCSNCKKEFTRERSVCDNCSEIWTISEQFESIVWKKSVNLVKKYSNSELKVANVKDSAASTTLEENRFLFSSKELNHLFWQWLTEASITLLSWEPWIWKSTFLMQLPEFLKDPKKILYISWEESETQIVNRAKRLNVLKHDINVAFCDSLEKTIAYLEEYKPDVFILDSLQTLVSESLDWSKGWIQQTKYCLSELISYLKPHNITSFFIWHVNKDWDIWGAKALEHLVDTVIYIEGETGRTDKFKILKVIKNRYWALDKIVCFEMVETWLKIISPEEASSYFIKDFQENSPWCVLGATLEWNQIFMSEIQSLAEKSEYSYPKRVITSFKSDRFDTLIATMKNVLKTQITDKDIYVNIINNTKFNTSDTLDLPILAAIISKLTGISSWRKVFIWRVWLLWEVRTVSWQDELIKKLKNLWFVEIISSSNCKSLTDLRSIIIWWKV